MRIGGNKLAMIEVLSTFQNEIGEDVASWHAALPSFFGWLDLSSGDSGSINYNAKIQESTHLFICDYFPLVYQEAGQLNIELTPENSRVIIDGKVYEVKIYDNPMGLNHSLEIYLNYTGGQ